MHLNLKDAMNSTVEKTVMRRVYIVALKSVLHQPKTLRIYLNYARSTPYASKTPNRCRRNTDVERSQCGTHPSFTLVQDKTRLKNTFP